MKRVKCCSTTLYSAQGRKSRARLYPADNLGGLGETVTTTYYNQLTLNSVFNNINSEVYVTSTLYDPAGRITERRMGDQGYLRTGYVYNAWTSQGGRLQKTISGMSTGQLDSLIDLRYTYGQVSNVLTNEAYPYDDAYRLTSAQASGGLFGGYPQEQYSYDATTGNLASKAGVIYTYDDAAHKHAVTVLSNGSSFIYDLNGNMTTRQVGGQTFTLAYDAENHMTGVSGAATANFTYNGDGARVIAVEGGVTTVFIGNYYEVRKTGQTTDITKYYYAGAQRVALRKNGAANPTFLFGDHLGSTGVAYDGATTAKQGYKAWGETRFVIGTMPTQYQFTGQFHVGYINLYWFGSRWYDPALSRWNQPDSIVPLASQGVQAWDRYAYANNNPVRYNDPTGHDVGCHGEDASQCNAPQPSPILTPKPTKEVYKPLLPIKTPTPRPTNPKTSPTTTLLPPTRTPATTPNPGLVYSPKSVPIAPGTPRIPEIRFRPPNPDWVDVGIDIFGLVGDASLVVAPVPGVVVDAIATGAEIIGVTKHLDSLDMGQPSAIPDLAFDISGLLLDASKVPPLVGSVASAIDLGLNFLPEPYLYTPLP